MIALSFGIVLAATNAFGGDQPAGLLRSSKTDTGTSVYDSCLTESEAFVAGVGDQSTKDSVGTRFGKPRVIKTGENSEVWRYSDITLEFIGNELAYLSARSSKYKTPSGLTPAMNRAKAYQILGVTKESIEKQKFGTNEKIEIPFCEKTGWITMLVLRFDERDTLKSLELKLKVPNPWATSNVLIVKSTPKYEAAFDAARTAEKELGMKMELGGYSPHRLSGLTLGEEECKKAGFDFPCYVARGRGADGVFASVEFSDAFPTFRKGLYITVLATGMRDDRLLKKVQCIFPDAYWKQTQIYLGCMH